MRRLYLTALLLLAPIAATADDPSATAEAVSTILEFPGRALRMARNARSSVEEYTWARVGDRWTALYAGAAA